MNDPYKCLTHEMAHALALFWVSNYSVKCVLDFKDSWTEVRPVDPATPIPYWNHICGAFIAGWNSRQ